MPGTNAMSRPASPGLASRSYEIMTAVSMTIGRGPLARRAVDAARLTPADRIIDIGCGPGAAVRLAGPGLAGRDGAFVPGIVCTFPERAATAGPSG